MFQLNVAWWRHVASWIIVNLDSGYDFVPHDAFPWPKNAGISSIGRRIIF